MSTSSPRSLNRDAMPYTSMRLGSTQSHNAKAAGDRGSGVASNGPSPTSTEPSPDGPMVSPSTSLALLSMLPTPPASLPTDTTSFAGQTLGHAGSPVSRAGQELVRINSELRRTPPRAESPGQTPPFAFDDLADDEQGDYAAMDVEGDLEFGERATSINGSSNVSLSTIAPFSSAAPIHRPFRSRYASSSTDSLTLDSTSHVVLDNELDIGSSHKRSHADVLPSTGMTPPASFDETIPRPTSLFSPPETAGSRIVSPRWRRSFSYDAQRAEPTTSVVAATATATAAAPLDTASSSSLGLLRRRARAPTETDPARPTSLPQSAMASHASLEPSQSKRRRSGTLSAGHAALSSSSPCVPGASHTTPFHRGSSIEEEPTSSRRRGRLGFNCFASAATSSIDADPNSMVDLITTGPLSPQRSQQTYNDLMSQAARSDALAIRGEGLLREAAGVLARAEEEVGRAAALVSSREADRERERVQDIARRLPSTDALSDPREMRDRPVIGIRLGEGWMPSPSSAAVGALPSPPSLDNRRRRSSLWSTSSGLSSPPLSEPQSPPHDGASLVSASHRARNFLTQLRARRPRLSRNATAVVPPESSEATSPSSSRSLLAGIMPDLTGTSAVDSATALRSWTLPSPPLAATLLGSAFDEPAEQAAAERLNRRLLERRRVSESLELGPPAATEATHPAPETSLWGETSGEGADSRATTRRLRGPTQVANERQRLGPPGAAPAYPPFVPAASGGAATSAATPTVQRESSSWRRLSQPPSVIDRASVGSGTQMGDAHFLERVRDDSPSPTRAGITSSTAALNAAEEGSTSRRFWRQGPGSGGPMIRLPRPDASAERPPLRSQVLLDDDADESYGRSSAATGAGWAAPATLPLMLPSGSDGTRMLFPHPAGASGPQSGESAASLERRRSASPYGQFGPDHLFHGPPPVELSAGNRRSMPWDALPTAAYPSRRPLMRFDPWADQPSTSTSATSANAVPVAAHNSARRSSLTEALTSFGARGRADGEPVDASLRRRRGLQQQPVDANPTTASTSDAELPFLDRRRAFDSQQRYGDETVEERLAQHRQSRMERLQALRRERHVMRTLLGGGPASPPVESPSGTTNHPWPHTEVSDASDAPQQPRSPGARSRGLGDFLRGLGTGARYPFGGRGGLIGIWDDDFPGFLTRDSAALDPRNYLDDDEFDTSYEALIRLSERLGDVKPKGASAETLASLRRFKYAEWPLPSRSSPAPAVSLQVSVASTSAHQLDAPSQAPATLARSGLDKETRCGICLCDYEDEDDCMFGRCEHGFHEECLVSWLSQKGTCPVCRRDHAGA